MTGIHDPQEQIISGTVRSVARVSEEAVLLRVEAEVQDGLDRPYDCRAGQFFMLRAWEEEPLLSRPMSVFDWRCVERTPGSEATIEAEFLCAERGRGTRYLARLPAGASIRLIGPLGNGWPLHTIPSGSRVALVGGGCGAAPLYLAAKRLAGIGAGIEVDAFLGFRGAPYKDVCDRYATIVSRVTVTSENTSGSELKSDSSAGPGRSTVIGQVTEPFDPNGYDVVLACGPRAMLAAIHRQCQREDVPLLVSLEERMACGVGACLGCAVKLTSGVRHVCKDGPVFRADEVVWDG